MCGKMAHARTLRLLMANLQPCYKTSYPDGTSAMLHSTWGPENLVLACFDNALGRGRTSSTGMKALFRSLVGADESGTVDALFDFTLREHIS